MDQGWSTRPGWQATATNFEESNGRECRDSPKAQELLFETAIALTVALAAALAAQLLFTTG